MATVTVEEGGRISIFEKVQAVAHTVNDNGSLSTANRMTNILDIKFYGTDALMELKTENGIAVKEWGALTEAWAYYRKFKKERRDDTSVLYKPLFDEMKDFLQTYADGIHYKEITMFDKCKEILGAIKSAGL